MTHSLAKTLLPKIIDFTIFFFCLFFSSWLMWHTFHSQDNQIVIAGKAWSDFASHIPLIRSFSLGPNLSQFPPQFPLFPGPSIRYHFLFYGLVGLLEKLGLPLDLALNLPSLLGLTSLTYLIYLLGQKLFHSRLVGLIALLLSLFNSSTSWFFYFQKQGWNFASLKNIFTSVTFPTFAPYDGGIVTGGFWNLNIFTNQRHLPLALSLPLLLLLLSTSLKRESLKFGLLAGFLVGLLPFLHGSVFIISLALLLSLLLLTHFKKTFLLSLCLSLLLALPQFLFLISSSPVSPPPFHFFPGYLAALPHLTLSGFLTFWTLNLGLTLFTLPAGLFLAPPSTRRLFLPFLLAFLIGNLLQFSPDISVNHKFFNFFLIGSNLFSAFFLVSLLKKPLLLKLSLLPLFSLLTFSGFIDLWPIKNDSFHPLDSWSNHPVASWIHYHTPQNSVFLNNTYLYHPASLVGRPIYMGWPYFAWSAGYDTYSRDDQMKTWLTGQLPKNQLCSQLLKEKISFIILSDQSPDYPTDLSFFKNQFIPTYLSPDSHWIIYSVPDSCPHPIDSSPF